MIYAITQAKIKNANNASTILNFTVSCMMYLYLSYIQCTYHSPNTAQEILNHCKVYYDEMYKSIESDISEELFIKEHNHIMKLVINDCELYGYIPCVTIHEFLNKLKEND